MSTSLWGWRLLRALMVASVLVTSAAVVGCCGDDKSKGGEASPEDTAAAITAAEKWMALIDAGKYAESYDETGALFRGAVTRDEWAAKAKGAREPLGALNSRTVASTAYSKTMPGAPAGEYVVITFNTSYANKASAVETVTPSKETDGTWRVSGYYIK